jgi:hypothetical protein
MTDAPICPFSVKGPATYCKKGHPTHLQYAPDHDDLNMGKLPICRAWNVTEDWCTRLHPVVSIVNLEHGDHVHAFRIMLPWGEEP